MAKNFIKRSNYEDFEPYCKWQRGQGPDILEVHLQDVGFKKEHLKVQLNNYGLLTISGEHSVDEAKISRFRKEIQVSKDYKAEEIRAKFASGILYITFPKVSTKPASSGPSEKSQVINEQEKQKTSQIFTSTQEQQNGALSGGESIRRRTIGKKMALGIAVVVALGIVVGGVLIWKFASNPAPIIY